jgi:hypothetical protein
MKYILCLALVNCGLISSAFAQGITDEAVVLPRSCETNNNILQDANEKAGETTLIMISRLGTSDTSNVVGVRRLHSAKAFLTEYLKVRESSRIVVALSNGPKSKKYGGIEIYVKGVLFDFLATKPNGWLGVGPCDSPEVDDQKSRRFRKALFPWLYK